MSWLVWAALAAIATLIVLGAAVVGDVEEDEL